MFDYNEHLKLQEQAFEWSKKIIEKYEEIRSVITSKTIDKNEEHIIIATSIICSDALYDLAYLVSNSQKFYSPDELATKLELQTNDPIFTPDIYCLTQHPDSLSNQQMTQLLYNDNIRYSQLENILRNACESYGITYALYDSYKNGTFNDVIKNFGFSDLEQQKRIFSSINRDQNAIEQKSLLNQMMYGIKNAISSYFPNQLSNIDETSHSVFVSSLNSILTNLKNESWYLNNLQKKSSLVETALNNNLTCKSEFNKTLPGLFLYSALSQSTHNNFTSIIDRISASDIEQKTVYLMNAPIENFSATLCQAYCLISDILIFIQSL